VLAAADGMWVDERLFIRGSPKNLGEVAPARVLAGHLGESDAAWGRGRAAGAGAADGGSGESADVARDCESTVASPVRAAGIVASTDNFGGAWDAADAPGVVGFSGGSVRWRDGWSIKRALRELMLTRAYQMSAAASDAKAEEADPTEPAPAPG